MRKKLSKIRSKLAYRAAETTKQGVVCVVRPPRLDRTTRLHRDKPGKVGMNSHKTAVPGRLRPSGPEIKADIRHHQKNKKCELRE